MPALVTATVLTLLAAPAAGSPAEKVVDDYPGALALARERGAPIFVDAWAPW